MIVVAARASVGETMAPSANAGAQSSPTSAWATTATEPTVAKTSPRASRAMTRRLPLKSRQVVSQAAA